MVFLYHRRIVCNSIAHSARAERRLPFSSFSPSAASSPPPSRMYIGQVASQGKLLFWVAKINSLIEMGQWWRLATASVLHANAMHLMVNCYSLSSIGSSVETMSGARRFLTIYITSAIASSVMSCCMSKAPAVGASGAIFGLISTTGDMWRYQELLNVRQLGGLLGGAITSWFIGPAWKYESQSIDGRRVFVDRAPIFHFANPKRSK